MSRPTLRDRILAAVALQPMTADQLAMCLSASLSAIRRHVRAMRYQRKLRDLEHVGRKGRPWVRYGVPA